MKDAEVYAPAGDDHAVSELWRCTVLRACAVRAEHEWDVRDVSEGRLDGVSTWSRPTVECSERQNTPNQRWFILGKLGLTLAFIATAAFTVVPSGLLAQRRSGEQFANNVLVAISNLRTDGDLLVIPAADKLVVDLVELDSVLVLHGFSRNPKRIASRISAGTRTVLVARVSGIKRCVGEGRLRRCTIPPYTTLARFFRPEWVISGEQLQITMGLYHSQYGGIGGTVSDLTVSWKDGTWTVVAVKLRARS